MALLHVARLEMVGSARSPSSDLTFFASSSARPSEYLEDITAQLPLSRTPKSLQGQALFAVDAATSAAELAEALRRLTFVDYVHVLLASCPISCAEPGSALSTIRDAAAAVTPQSFATAIALWRAMRLLESSEGGAPPPSEDTSSLVFRSLGKRGGRGHDFSSDEAKRAAKHGLTAATGLAGSSSTFDFEIMAQVHHNRFWLGLRLNRAPLAPQLHAQPRATPSSPPPAQVLPDTGGVAEVSARQGAPHRRNEAAPAAERRKKAASVPSRPTASEHSELAEPPLLSGFMAARLAELGIDRPRDARDAVAPLWEIPLAAQHERKQAEMQTLATKLLSSHMTDGAGKGPPHTTASPDGVDGGRVCELLRSVAEGEGAMRNTCEMAVGRDRDGNAICGFRLGAGSGKDGQAVGSPDGVPFVPAWMVAVASEMTAAMRAADELAGVDEAGIDRADDGAKDNGATLPLPYQLLRLRGSLRTHDAVAVLTPASVAPAGVQATSTEVALARRFVAAAAAHGMTLGAVLARDTTAKDGCRALLLLPGTGELERLPEEEKAPVGSIVEELSSGLRLRVSPLAFFQASTAAAEVLFTTLVELVCERIDSSPSRRFPALVLDLCCGGGVLGLEVARAAAAAGAPHTKVVGIELNASAVLDARANAAANGLTDPLYHAMCAKAEIGIDAALAQCRPSDGIAGSGTSRDADEGIGGVEGVVAIVDPPRTGLAPSVCKALRAAEGVGAVVFVSCNPHGHNLRHDYVVKGGSLAANLRVLCAPRGRGAPFRIARIVPVDLFPHTPHCELLVLCVREARAPRKSRRQLRAEAAAAAAVDVEVAETGSDSVDGHGSQAMRALTSAFTDAFNHEAPGGSVGAPPPPPLPTPGGAPPLGSILMLVKETGRSREVCKAALVAHANEVDAARVALLQSADDVVVSDVS